MNLSLDRNTIVTAKALVISSVVLGHILEAILLNGKASHATESFYHIIYLVHMPFYFLLSGWLFKGAQEKKGYFIKKTKHLLLPYLAWLLLFNFKALSGFAINLFQGNLSGDKLNFYQSHFYSQLYGGMEVHGFQMILWFPTCLFFTQQLANLILNKFDQQKTKLIGIGFAFYTLALVNQFLYPSFHLPLAVNVVAGALPFFLMGYLLKMNPLKNTSNWFLVISCLIACVLIFFISTKLSFHMRKADYGFPILSMLAAVGGFFLILKLSKQLAQLNIFTKMFNQVSQASMTIMYIHALILVIIRGLGIMDISLLLLLGVLIPTLIHILLSKFNMLSKFFLGEDQIGNKAFSLSFLMKSKNT